MTPYMSSQQVAILQILRYNDILDCADDLRHTHCVQGISLVNIDFPLLIFSETFEAHRPVLERSIELIWAIRIVLGNRVSKQLLCKEICFVEKENDIRINKVAGVADIIKQLKRLLQAVL